MPGLGPENMRPEKQEVGGARGGLNHWLRGGKAGRESYNAA